jgi:hypothetical protein
MKYNTIALLAFLDAYTDEFENVSFLVFQYYFGIGRSTYTNLIATYLDSKPSQLRYELGSQSYRKGVLFERQYNSHMASFSIIEHHAALVNRPVLSLSKLKALPKEELLSEIRLISDY